MMNFEELDDTTRKWMREEFKTEREGENPPNSELMTDKGLSEFPRIMEEQIKNGNEVTLENALLSSIFWKPSTTRHRKGKPYEVSINPKSAARMFALTEFNILYVRGLARRLMEEGVEKCQVYRAEPAIEPRCECKMYENQIFDVKKIYDGHRAKYHPKPNPTAFSIPSGPNCHHTIRRIHN